MKSIFLDIIKSRFELIKVFSFSKIIEILYYFIISVYSAFRVLNNGASSKHFQVTSSVEQGCFFAPTLFSLMLVVVLTEAYEVGIPIDAIKNYTISDVYTKHRAFLC